MTYEDPNQPRRSYPMTEQTSYTGWIIGALAVLAAVILGVFAFSGPTDKNNTASRPAPTSTATTGSGTPSSVIPNNPAGTAPQNDTNQPTLTPRPAPAR